MSTSERSLTITQGFLIAGITILGTLLFSPVGLILSQVIDKELAMLVNYIFGMGAPLLVIFIIYKRKLPPIEFHPPGYSVFPFILIATVALVLGIIMPVSELIPVPDNLKALFSESLAQKGVATFILMVIAAPLLEELIFRGILLNGLLNKYSALKSILVSSLLFGLVHLNPWQFLGGLLLGVFIGAVFYHTRNLIYPIMIHSTANLCGYFFRVFSDPSDLEKTTFELYGGATASIFVIVSSSILFVGCLLFLHKFSKTKQAAFIGSN